MSVKLKYKLVSSDFQPATHVSIVTINTDAGRFTGVAKCSKKDYEWESNYFGCELAEIRAGIKYMKAKLREARAKKKVMQDYYNIVSGMTSFNSQSPEMSKARRVLHECDEEIADWKKIIKSAYETIDIKVALREKTMKKLKPRAN